ncbi:MAG: hypothetical protein JWM59_3615 [Verrucomicrobiales bacterium]|nr:hypothetical protein [Verrucomicrobiales bacterium]
MHLPNEMIESARRMRAARQNAPRRSSEEAYAQMEEMRKAMHGLDWELNWHKLHTAKPLKVDPVSESKKEG